MAQTDGEVPERRTATPVHTTTHNNTLYVCMCVWGGGGHYQMAYFIIFLSTSIHEVN